MEEILNLLKTDFEKGLALLKKFKKDSPTIQNHIKEYKFNDRNIRPSQVGQIQKDKIIGKGENRKQVIAIREIVPFQKKIVKTAVAFEIGKPITIKPRIQNKLTDEVLAIYDENRIFEKLQNLKTIQKSQTEAALQFYFVKRKDELGKEELVIRSKVLSNENGELCPYFDDYGDMICFTFIFKTIKDNKTIHNVWVYDDRNCYKSNNESGTMNLVESLPHGFSKIPIVYVSQEFTEWHDVQSLIDRYETALSKLGGSNDYSGYPLLKLYGELVSMPDRNEDGKTLRFPMKEIDDSSGKTIHGDAEFLTNNNAPESVKLESETIENLIFSMTATPNLSFDNLKGSLGNISGIALKLLFLDSIIKASLNEGENRTMVERTLKIIASGIITTINQSLKSQIKEMKFNITFNSIIPSDVKEAVEIASNAKNSGIMSVKTAVEFIDFNSDTDNELNLIEQDSQIQGKNIGFGK